MTDKAQPVIQISETARGGVIALGNFDGVHRGHQRLITVSCEVAKQAKIPARILTFEPHPREVFNPAAQPFRLTPTDIKASMLKHYGIDEVVVLPFVQVLYRLSAQDFVTQILIKKLGAQHVVVGENFTFGFKRTGTSSQLQEWLEEKQIGTSVVATKTDMGGEVFSSTRIREALVAGDPNAASIMLGRPWLIRGIVEHGDQRGRTIGVPTANIALKNYLRPLFGVYAIKARMAGSDQTYGGVANIGVRPTVAGEVARLEAHLFDFSADMYDQVWDVELLDFIRAEQKFADFDALKTQIIKDIEAAKTRLASHV